MPSYGLVLDYQPFLLWLAASFSPLSPYIGINWGRAANSAWISSTTAQLWLPGSGRRCFKTYQNMILIKITNERAHYISIFLEQIYFLV